MTSVSIIVPVRNEAACAPDLIRLHRSITIQAEAAHRRIEHLNEATSGDLCELIVIDGGSTDNTVQQLTAAGVRVLSAPPGRASQMNVGASAAAGNVLLFLHADTTLPDDAANHIATALTKGRSWGRFDVRITGKSRWLPVIARAMNFRSRISGIATGDQAIFVTRELFARVQGFADIPLMEDIRLCQNLLKDSKPACLRTKVYTSGRRWDENGPLRVIVLMWLLRFGHWRGIAPSTLALLYCRDFSLRVAARVCLRS